MQGTDSAGLLVGRATLAGAASQRTRKPGRPWLKWVVVPGLLVVANGGAWYGFVRGTPMQGSKMTSGSLVPSVQSSHATPRQGSLEPGIPATTTVAPSAGIETVLTTPPLVIVSARTLEPTTKSPGSREASGLRAQDKKVRRSKAKAGPADSLTSPSTAREAIPETPDFD